MIPQTSSYTKKLKNEFKVENIFLLKVITSSSRYENQATQTSLLHQQGGTLW